MGDNIMELALKRGEQQTKVTFQLFYFLTFFGFGSLFPLLSVYLKETVGLSGTEIGAIMSISPIVMIFVQPFWGMVSDYTQKPVKVLTITLIGTAMIGIVYSFIEQYAWFLVIAALLAFTQSAIVPLSDSITLNYVQKSKGNYGSIRLWGAVGFAVSVLVGGRLAEMFSIEIIFYLFALVLCLSALFAWKLPRESQTMKVHILDGMKRLIKIPKFLLFLLTTFLVFGPIYANNFYFGVFVKEIGGTLTGVGIAFLLAAGSEAPFMKIADSFIRRYGMLSILLFAAFISACRWLFYFFEPSLTLVYITTIAQGFSVGLFIPAALQYVRDAAPESVRATAVSIYSAVGNGLGSWFCTFIGGYIIDQYHIGHVYLFFSILTFAGLLILLVIMILEGKKRG
jgi:MFS transporter, PPP family, 3-phenylpropionic acid transporter